MDRLLKILNAAIISFFCLSLIACNSHWESEWVKIKGKQLVYKQDHLGNHIPDFSSCGYEAGQSEIPDIPIVKTLKPVAGDNWQQIQSAINDLSKMPLKDNGFRGKILLHPGNYDISKTIRIFQSGIVLSGKDNKAARTILTATSSRKYNLIEVKGSGSLKIDANSITNITSDYIAVGAKEISVSSASNFKIGDHIILRRDSSSKWIHDIGMDRIPPNEDGRYIEQWPVEKYLFDFERRIVDIQGNKLLLDAPVVMAIEQQYNGGQIIKVAENNRLRHVGIENLTLVSDYSDKMDENHGWTALQLDSLENGWVRNVTSKHFGYSCVNLERGTRFITVENCQSLAPVSKIAGGRRYAFKLAGQQNLVKDCYADSSRHPYLTDSRVMGPNVFYNCRADNCLNDTGPHHRWAMGILYDNVVVDSSINVQDRSNLGSGHGWSGVNHVIWNCAGSDASVQNPPGGQNWCIGFQGERKNGRFPGRPSGYWEGNNRKGLIPKSLYLAQKEAAKK